MHVQPGCSIGGLIAIDFYKTRDKRVPIPVSYELAPSGLSCRMNLCLRIKPGSTVLFHMTGRRGQGILCCNDRPKACHFNKEVILTFTNIQTHNFSFPCMGLLGQCRKPPSDCLYVYFGTDSSVVPRQLQPWRPFTGCCCRSSKRLLALPVSTWCPFHPAYPLVSQRQRCHEMGLNQSCSAPTMAFCWRLAVATGKTDPGVRWGVTSKFGNSSLKPDLP